MSLQSRLWELFTGICTVSQKCQALSWENPAFHVSSDMVTVTGLSTHPTFLWFFFFQLSAGVIQSLFPVKSQALSWLVFVPSLCL